MPEENAQSTAQESGEKPDDQATKAAPGAQKSSDEGKGGKDAVLADLAKERDKRQALENQVAEMAKAQKTQTDALAAAFGLKSEGDKSPDVTAQIAQLSEQFAASQRKATLLEVAADPGQDDEGNALPPIPKEYHLLLTATETEALQAQAKALALLLKANGKTDETPGFAQSAGQGQNGGKTPTVPQQIAAAERELAGMTRGTPEHRQQQQRVMALKSQQLTALHDKQ